MMESERSRISYRLSRISNVVYFIGLIVFFALPYFNHRISTSEHGLTVGNLNSDFNSMKMKAALRMMDDYHCDNTTALSLPLDWIRQRMESDGMKTHIHTFTRSGRHLVGHNIVGKIQAKKSVGIDSIVISFPYVSSGEGNITECASSINRVAVAVSLMDHLKDVNWLHKDIIFLGYDGRWEYNEAVDAWLESIFTPGSDYSVDSITSSSIIASISLEFTSLDTNRLALLALGINGQLPDMDLVATLVYFSQVNLLPYKRIYDIFSLLPDKIGGMLTFMINQASGVPKGSHAYFMKYNIPGVTIADVQESVSSVHHNNAMELIVSLGRTLELAIHSLNNLIEPLHASFLFYLLPDLRSVVPSSEYSIAMAFFVAYGAIKATSILILERVNFQYVLWSTLCIVTATLGSMIPHLAWLLPLDLEPWMVGNECATFAILHEGPSLMFVTLLFQYHERNSHPPMESLNFLMNRPYHVNTHLYQRSSHNKSRDLCQTTLDDSKMRLDREPS
eukprot:TRINITY_DN214_c0_g1_i5.p1 TRINITY_DN214_c0_g1~~TRINITY_DN214_c0_g1_i5.p1  ORF type:complete len:506 (-),score=49.53 TRINITY_DN214_c0_g1_i5:709-2226(-)